MSLLSQVHHGKRPAPRRCMIHGVQGVGKAQPLDANVLTPHGFVTMGSLRVGDQVIGSDGKAHNIIGIYPQGEKEVYRVTFRDGSTTRCCDDHLWFTQTFLERREGLSGAVRTLRDIRRSLRYGTHFNHGVPRVRPVTLAPLATRLPIDPWLLGMYLGDGHWSCSIGITKPEADVQAKIAASLDEHDVCGKGSPMGVSIKSRQNGRPTVLKSALRDLGLEGLHSHEKFVPPTYLHADIEQRLSLLRGLLDSDGHVTKPGAVEFCTTSPRLADDVCFLIRSLGGSVRQILKPKPTFRHRGQLRVGLPAYRVFASFPADTVPVSSQKHLSKWAEPRWAIRHTIRSVEPVGVMPCQCIRIDAPDSLYVTDDFILTHNSTFAATSDHPVFVQTEDGLGEIDCAKFPLSRTFGEVMAALTELRSAAHEFRTVVVDSLDWLERLIWQEVCTAENVSNIEKIGFQKGYTFALNHWRKFLDALDDLRRERGMAVVLIAHTKIEKFQTPEDSAFDRFSPRLHKLAAAVVMEWCDEVFFATYSTTTDPKKVKNVEAERVMRTAEGPTHVAKNRLKMPFELPLEWAAYEYFAQQAHSPVPATPSATPSPAPVSA